MAQATAHKEVTEVTLKVSADEAYALSACLARVNGDSELSPRKHTLSVLTALKGAGFRPGAGNPANDAMSIFQRNGILFDRYPVQS